MPSAVYDPFTGPELDPAKWAPLSIPLPDGSTWTTVEPQARRIVGGGTLRLRIEPFTRCHDEVQIFDNPKELWLSSTAFPLPPRGRLRFSVEMAVETFGGDPHDYRDGFAAFNVLDMATGMVFDHAATSRHLYSIYERLLVPGVDRPWTYIVESPLAGLETGPGDWHLYEVEVDAQERTARWAVDDKPVYEVAALPVVPRELRVGFGLFTLHPIVRGKSVSLRGQGGEVALRNLRVAN